MTSPSTHAYLIVNADDFGYFDCVSRGILQCASEGIVTATGVLANSERFAEHCDWLKNNGALDIGVHLNITDRRALTATMRERLAPWAGCFPDKVALLKALWSGSIRVDHIRSEWRAQVERCLDNQLNILFLNSHEHVHMLPSLLPVIQELADEYGIAHIRFPSPELFRNLTAGALVRDLTLQMMGTLNRSRVKRPAARFLGMSQSGRLDLAYLQRTLPKLEAGQVYELMCHPGFFDADEISDPRLLKYHDWRGELDALTNPAARHVLAQHRVRLIGYRHVRIQGGKYVVSDEEAVGCRSAEIQKNCTETVANGVTSDPH